MCSSHIAQKHELQPHAGNVGMGRAVASMQVYTSPQTVEKYKFIILSIDKGQEGKGQKTDRKVQHTNLVLDHRAGFGSQNENPNSDLRERSSCVEGEGSRRSRPEGPAPSRL